MLLADDGHDVIVLERDAAEPIASIDGAWDDWERRGVNQFRLPHLFLSGYRRLIESELPRVASALEAAGAVRTNFFRDVPEAIRGPERPEDGEIDLLSGRRPVVESVIAATALATPRLEIRRGQTVEALVTGRSTTGGAAHVVGVRTNVEEIRADLVVDVMGRRSALPRLLDEAGARPPLEELEDCGFMYFGRHFRSKDGSMPFLLGGVLQDYGTISSVTLPADNGTWGMVLVTSSKDKALLGLRNVERWDAAVRSLPLVAHWLDGEPLDDRVTTMAKIEDRIRTYVVDGKPAVTGVVSVSDAWACSNPSHGRGVSIGMLHAREVRDQLRDVGLDDPAAYAIAFQEASDRNVRPWFEWTRDEDRHRLGEIHAGIDGEDYQPNDPNYELEKALASCAAQDPELLRLSIRSQLVLDLQGPALQDPNVADRILELGGKWRDDPTLGPSRDELTRIVNG